eukprot:6474547-Amphidinium_carterae.2
MSQTTRHSVGNRGTAFMCALAVDIHNWFKLVPIQLFARVWSGWDDHWHGWGSPGIDISVSTFERPRGGQHSSATSTNIQTEARWGLHLQADGLGAATLWAIVTKVRRRCMQGPGQGSASLSRRLSSCLLSSMFMLVCCIWSGRD